MKAPYLVNDHMLGKCLVGLGKHAEAAPYFKKVVDSGPQASPDDEIARQEAIGLLKKVGPRFVKLA